MVDPIYLNIFVKYIVLYFISRNIQKPDQVFCCFPLDVFVSVFGDVFVKQRVTLLSKAKSDVSQLDGSNKIGQQMQGNTLKKGVTQRHHSMKPPDHREPFADRFIWPTPQTHGQIQPGRQGLRSSYVNIEAKGLISYLFSKMGYVVKTWRSNIFPARRSIILQ